MKKKIAKNSIIFVIAASTLLMTGCGDFINEDETTEFVEIEAIEPEPVKIEVKEAEISKYDATPGVLNTVMNSTGEPAIPQFLINSAALFGSDHVEKKEEVQGKEFKQSDLNHSFWPGEYVSIFIQTDYEDVPDNVEVWISPHTSIEEYQGMKYDSMYHRLNDGGGKIIPYQAPNEYGWIGEFQFDKTMKPGLWDMLFLYNGKISQFIVIKLTKK